MPIVKMPDGTQVRFPDDMPREQIRDMIASKFPEVAQQVAKPQANPDGTFGQPPEGMVLNPATGQMEDLRSPANPNIPQGGANALALGVGQGTGFNMLDEASAALSVPFGGDYDYNLARMREAERRASEEHPVAYYGGQIGGALGTGIGLAKGGLSATNAAINSGAKLPTVALASGAEGAALGAGYGFGAGEGTEGRLDSAKMGGFMGGALGAATPYVMHGISKAYSKARSPFTASTERTAAAQTLSNEGVPLSAGQKTGSKWLQYRESELGGVANLEVVFPEGLALLSDWPETHGLADEVIAHAIGRYKLRSPQTRQTHIIGLVISMAVMNRIPDFEVPVPEMQMITRKGNASWFRSEERQDAFGRNFNIEVDGYNYRSRRPYADAYRKYEFLTDPVSDILGRIDYQVWVAALKYLESSLMARLVNHRLVHTDLSYTPWNNGHDGAGVELISTGTNGYAKKFATIC